MDKDSTREVENSREIQTIAPRTYWVGHRLENDVFQCHAYLIEQGDQSILVDPGSLLTFESTLQKIEQILPFSSIRYFLCHHQDPDIAASLPRIDGMIKRKDAVVVTHWRSRALLKHYDLKNLGFWLIEENNWELKLQDRSLKFIFTPYAHFPGAFASFDESTGVLFSSDLFGGFTEEFHLYAQDESYFESMRPFHEHYIPGRDILEFALTGIRKHPVRTIAPQHGSIITGELVPFFMEKLRHLDCGIYLFTRRNTDIQRLSRLNETLREITRIMLLYRDFRDIAGHLLEIVRRELPVVSMEFYSTLEDGNIVHLITENNYSPVFLESPDERSPGMGLQKLEWESLARDVFEPMETIFSGKDYILLRGENKRFRLHLPLFSPMEGRADAIAILHLTESISQSEELEEILNRVAMPLQVALERETIYQNIERERKRTYEQSIRDPLTGFFNRIYMIDVMNRHCELQDRHPGGFISVVMLDIDHFKSVNDTYGHRIGDLVLHHVSALVLADIRSADVPVRYGGEEFCIFLIGENLEGTRRFTRRILRTLATTPVEIPDSRPIFVTVSAGIALRRPGEKLDDFIQRADRALYRSKNEGRNRYSISG